MIYTCQLSKLDLWNFHWCKKCLETENDNTLKCSKMLVGKGSVGQLTSGSLSDWHDVQWRDCDFISSVLKKAEKLCQQKF